MNSEMGRRHRSANVYVPLSAEIMERKPRCCSGISATQRSKDWFDADTFRGSPGCAAWSAAPERYAEGFICARPFQRRLMLRLATSTSVGY